jgi:hypothetical protein
LQLCLLSIPYLGVMLTYQTGSDSPSRGVHK